MLVAQCPDRESLRAFSTGRLSSEQTDDVAAHVESCSDCLSELTTLADDGDSLVSELRAPVDDEFLQEPAFVAAVAEARTLLHRVRESSEPASSPAPRVLGEYELLDELGRGGMGRVYRARHTKLDRIVAVKVLPSGRLESAQAIVRFEREMRAIGGLDHPHIVHAYDGREIEQMPVLVMEYVDGMDLAEVVRRLGRLKPADACELVRQAAVGLQYAHTKGLVHRDIKPSNLMLTRDGVVKVLDLGLARFSIDPSGEEVTGAGQAMGTADYIAPEQVGDSHAADIRSDIYSLGCTLYKLLAGRAPYSSRRGGVVDKMNAHLSGPLPPIEQQVPQVPAQLVAVLQRMMAKQPEQRFATPDEVVEAIEPLCDGADTKKIIKEAESISPPAEDEQSNGASDSAKQHRVEPDTERQRWKPWHWLIALGLMSCVLGIGFAAGVTLTVNKNGQATTIELPDGAHASVTDVGDVAVKLPDDADVKESVGRVPLADPADLLKSTAAMSELRQLRHQNQLQERMIEMLKARLSYAARTVKLPDPTPKTAAEHAEALTSAVNQRHREGAALDLAAAEDDVYHRTVETLFEAIDSERETTRASAVRSLRTLFQIVPHRMDRYADRFAERLVPLLSHEGLVDWAMGALATLGPAGRPALETLQQIIVDPQSEYSLFAAMTVAAIDPSIDIVPRLMEIIEKRRHNWLAAINLLPDYAPPAQARRILDDLHAKLDAPEHRQVIEQALLRIPADQQTSPAEADRGGGNAAPAQVPESIRSEREAIWSDSKQDP